LNRLSASFSLTLAAIVFVALALIPVLGSGYWTGQATRYVLFGMFAMSLSLLWGRAGMLTFGHAVFFGIGGYVMATMTMGLFGDGILSELLAQPWIALPVSVGGAALAAAALGWFLFWGRGVSGAYLAIITLSVAVVVEQAVRGFYALGGDNGLVGVPALATWAADPFNPVPMFYTVLVIAAVVYVGLDRLLRSRMGALLTAVSANPDRLGHFGYSVFVVRLGAFVLGAAIAGLAGALFVATDGFASPSLIGFGLSAEVLIWVALGGRNILLAAFLGAVAVRLAESFLSGLLGDFWLLALGMVFMASVVLLPQGLIATPMLWLNNRWNQGNRSNSRDAPGPANDGMV
jgi:urea transport system permease protein